MDDPQTIQETPQFTFKKRPAKGKSSFRKRPATPPPASDSDSGFTSSENEQGHRIKRRRQNGAVKASSAVATDRPRESHAPSTAPTISHPSDDATKASNWYDDNGTSQSLSAKSLLGSTRTNPTSGNDGTYKGVAAYQSFIQKNPNAPSSQTKQVGPIKAPTNVRTITVTDFAPDVCKDYKQTGFCGYGDNCKYLHAREDYKHGWELDRDWEIGTKGKKLTGRTVASANRPGTAAADTEDGEDEDALLESIPFACIICKNSYTNPIITKCGHYFCEACALQRYRKNPSCAACGAGTGGVFNVAKKLKRLLERKRERAKQRREEAREKGEEVSDDDADGDEDGED